MTIEEAANLVSVDTVAIYFIEIDTEEAQKVCGYDYEKYFASLGLMMGSIWIGYICIVINYIFYCCGRFMRKKEHILFMDLFAKAFTILGLYFLGSLTEAYNMCLIFIMNIVCYYKTKRHWKLALLYWIFESLLVMILFTTYTGLSSALVFSCSTLTLMANWWFSPQQMRLTAVCGSVLYLMYQISIRNWAGLLEVVTLGSNVLSFLRCKHNR